MDPLSAAFASYLDLVSSRVTERMTDVLGTEMQAVVVEHQGVRVPYAYQVWRIRPQSVCSPYRRQIAQFSACTLAAHSLFQDTCAYLQAHPQEHWKHLKLKNMYCEAAITYQPTLADVQWSREPSPREQARSACNLAVAALMNEPSPENRRKKEDACMSYEALKAP